MSLALVRCGHEISAGGHCHKKPLTPEEAAAKKEAEMIDEVADELLKNRVDPIRTAHDGLVQQNDVFTNSLRSTPGGRGTRKRGQPRRALNGSVTNVIIFNSLLKVNLIPYGFVNGRY